MGQRTYFIYSFVFKPSVPTQNHFHFQSLAGPALDSIEVCREYCLSTKLTEGNQKEIMGIRFPSVLTKQILQRSSTSMAVPKGFLVVYVEKIEKKRFVVPVSYLNEPSFRELLSKAEEEFGFDHPIGGLTIPCSSTDRHNLSFQPHILC
ncbi:auxin-responsive protein SAUR23-like [Tripterygium wilfordii]|uniref:auxin-responsive protein SAUR23-like n=1 Tax=Tripterygium wilfordii TaxID=458696 RepID=UPI0018F81282|nr:auxin-responsive protein SAUR23-like [Tripterygium wilfordii]